MSLAQIFGTFVHTENQQQENSSDESEEKVGPASSNGFFGSTLMDLEAVAQQMEDSEAGQKTGEAENEVGMADTNPGLDFSALAMQLLQQAQGLFGASNGAQQQREEPEQQKPSPVEPVQSMPFGAQPPNRTDGSSASTPPAASVSSPKRKSGGGHSGSRRSGSKSLLSAATAAALLAPSPLGQIPSIPGAIAVAVSPAAQLFREDDWSWHRNPVAAIRSGGLNKQTPVWKYFVYNKAENLSRCIVGNCTYQLKGPHTSTLACHLKKHVAEYAEFQRLKVEYTRERIASGHGQAGQDPFNGDSGCSTPTSQNNGFLGVGGQLNPCSGLQLSQNGSRSPSALPTQFAASDGERQRFQQQQQKGGGSGGGGNCSASSAGSSSLSCASSPGPPPSLACWQPPNCQQTQYQTGMATQQQQAGGSIFAPSSGGANLPAPPMGGFHQFMMAATLAAAQQLQQQQQQQQQQQITQKNTMVAEQQNGLRQNGGSESHSIGSIKAGEQEQKQQQQKQQQPLQMTSPNGVVNGGCSSLLDILNLLSKRATHSQQAPLDQEREEEEPEEKPAESSASSRARSHELLEEQAENGAADQQTQQSAEQVMQRRRSRKRTSSDATGLERGEDTKTKRRETAGTRADRTTAATGGGGGGLATHSVEHLLGQRSGEGGSAEEIDGSSVNSIVESANDLEATTGDGQQAMDKLMDGLALSLGTGLPRAELARLFDNPFLGDCLAGLSLDRVDQVLEQHFQRLKRRIQEQLARAGKEGVVALMAELCCSSCWKVPAGIKKEEDNGGGVSGLCLTKGCDGSVHFWCSLSAIFCPSAAAGRSENRQKRILLLAVRQMRAAESMESQLEEILASVPFPAECQPTLLLLRPMQLLTGDHPLPGLRCLPALFPDCLDRAFRCALADDRSLLLMLTKFRRMLEKFCASQGCQGEWKELTGHCLTLSHTLQATANSSQHQMELLNVAALLLPRQEQLQDIAARHLLDGDKKSALLDEEEWLLLNELARLLGLFRAEMRNGEGPARIPLSQVGGCLANVQKTLQKDFHALGDFPRKLNAELEKRTSPWVKQADGPYSTEIGNTAAAPTFHDVPCTPVSLSKVFGRNGDGWEWAGEEERWLERSALLLFNNHLLRNPEEL